MDSLERSPDQASASRPGRSTRAMMAAVVLGTALSAMGTDARAAVSDPKAITDISKYCTVCWRNARLPEDRWGDCTQEVLVRLLERVGQDRWSSIFAEETTERKEFLRAIDAVKKRTQRSRKLTTITNDHADWRDEITNELRTQRESLNFAADRVLSERQRNILEMASSGWAIPEIATKLGMSVDRISDEKYKAIRKLRSHFGIV